MYACAHMHTYTNNDACVCVHRCLTGFEGNKCKNPLTVIASGNEESNAMVECMNQYLTPATAAYGLIRIVSVVKCWSRDHFILPSQRLIKLMTLSPSSLSISDGWEKM